jgi:predicted nicotinamide N-methyase
MIFGDGDEVTEWNDLIEENQIKSDEISRRKIRGERNWGLPTFKDQLDRGITYYDLVIHNHPNTLTVRSQLEFRKNSTGSDIWDCTLVLAHFFAIHSTFIQGAVVLELGSGVGALGMILYKLGAAKVILTDLEPNCDLIRRNVEQNFSYAEHGMEYPTGSLVRVKTLDWGTKHFDEFFSSDKHSVDISRDDDSNLLIGKRLVVVGSDLFLPFAAHLLRPLCETIAALLQYSSSKINPSSLFVSGEVFLAYEERFDCSLFYTYADEFNLQVDRISDDELHPIYRDPGIIFVLHITLKVA